MSTTERDYRLKKSQRREIYLVDKSLSMNFRSRSFQYTWSVHCQYTCKTQPNLAALNWYDDSVQPQKKPPIIRSCIIHRGVFFVRYPRSMRLRSVLEVFHVPAPLTKFFLGYHSVEPLSAFPPNPQIMYCCLFKRFPIATCQDSYRFLCKSNRPGPKNPLRDHRKDCF